MHSAIDLIQECQERDIALSITDRGEITYRAPKGSLDSELRQRLRESKQIIAKALKESGKRSLIAHSKVLDRDIIVSWTGDNPKVVYVDRTPYTLEEIAELKGATPGAVRSAHLVKEEFEGEIIGPSDGENHEQS